MGIPRAGRADSNQKEIVKALRGAGCFVHMFGKLDALVAHNGLWYVLEFKPGDKPPSQQKLTRDEIVFILEVKNRAPIYLVRSVEEAFSVVGLSHPGAAITKGL